jgi:hypothetical protein
LYSESPVPLMEQGFFDAYQEKAADISSGTGKVC